MQGDVLAGGALRGPPERYSASELWAYIESLWRDRSDDAPGALALRLMTGRGDTFDRDRARDVVCAVLVNHGGDRAGLSDTAPLLPRHLLSFINAIHR